MKVLSARQPRWFVHRTTKPRSAPARHKAPWPFRGLDAIGEIFEEGFLGQFGESRHVPGRRHVPARGEIFRKVRRNPPPASGGARRQKRSAVTFGSIPCLAMTVPPQEWATSTVGPSGTPWARRVAATENPPARSADFDGGDLQASWPEDKGITSAQLEPSAQGPMHQDDIVRLRQARWFEQRLPPTG